MTNVTVNYIVLGTKKFCENVNVWHAVLQKPYNIRSKKKLLWVMLSYEVYMYVPSLVEIQDRVSFSCVDFTWNFP